MKLFIKVFLYVFSYLILFLLMVVLMAGNNNDGSKGLSNIEFALTIVIPSILLFVYSRIKRLKVKKRELRIKQSKLNKQISEEIEEDWIIFKSFRKQKIPNIKSIDNRIKKLPNEIKSREIADALLTEANRSWSLAQESNLPLYIHYCQETVVYLLEASKYEEKAKYDYYNSPTHFLETLYREVQWKMRDAIEREADYIIQEVSGPQRNNKKTCCSDFAKVLKTFSHCFSDETYEFANEQYYRVANACGVSVVSSEEASIMDKVDLMDGIEFEYFCCELLEKNGFEEVSTTMTSGDQGIDILATKDDIRYAIQCKCYSKDLGNKPVQEAFAGKSIYSCQVAAVMTNRYFTQGGKDAANATGVLLWDRDKLISFIDHAYIDR